MDYNQLSKDIYAQNKAVGWWDDPNRCLFETLQLVSTEVAEATEAERKNLADDHLPHRKGGEVELADAMIRVLDLGGRMGWQCMTVHTTGGAGMKFYSVGRRHLYINERVCRLAKMMREHAPTPVLERCYTNLVGTICEVSESFGYDLRGAMLEKLEYNRHRADHKRENRAKANGKRF